MFFNFLFIWLNGTINKIFVHSFVFIRGITLFGKLYFEEAACCVVYVDMLGYYNTKISFLRQRNAAVSIPLRQ